MRFTYILLFVTLLMYSCTTKDPLPSGIEEVEFLEYVSSEPTRQDNSNGDMTKKKSMDANYALSFPKSLSIEKLHSQIDSIMCSFYSDKFKEFDRASFSFFKKTDITNNENLGRSKRQFSDYSEEHDMLVSYEWSNGIFIARHDHYTGSIFPVESTWNKWIFNCPNLH